MKPLPKELQPLADQVAEWFTKRAVVKEHLATNLRDRGAHNRAVEVNSAELADSEVTALLNNTKSWPQKLLDRLRNSPDVANLLDARIRGLESKLVEIDQEIATAKDELRKGWHSYSWTLRSDAKNRIRARSLQFVSDIAEDLAAGRALSDSTTMAMQRGIGLTDLGTGRDLAWPINAHGWKENPAMMTKLTEVQDVLTSVESILRQEE